MEELSKFQSSAFDTMARRKFVEDQNTILELSGRVQELQNEVNCMNDSKDFQDMQSVKSILPNTENSMQYGYDENDNNNMSNETKRETNYSINNK